MLSKIETTE